MSDAIMFTDPTAQELWELCNTVPGMGVPDRVYFCHAYALLRQAKALEALPAVLSAHAQAIAQGMTSAMSTPQQSTLTLPDLPALTIHVPDTLHVYDASVSAPKGTTI